MKEKSISGRITADTVFEMEYLKRQLGLNQTAVLQTAIHLFYEQTLGKKKSPTRDELFKQSGYLEPCSADSGLSTNYKQELYEYLKKKHRPR